MNIHRQLIRRLGRSCLAITLSCGLFASIAAADASAEPRTVAVSYADLNLSNPEGAKVLYTRIRRAARTVCGASGVNYPITAGSAAKARACVEQAVDEAVAKVDSRVLTAMHKEKAPRRFG